MSTNEPAAADAPEGSASLLADLESRQDELLRLLAELEARTEQALAALGVNVGGTPATGTQTGAAALAPATTPSAEANPSAPLPRSANVATKTPRRKAA